MVMTGDRVELSIDGTWTDITRDVYERDPISISRGMPDRGTQADPGRATLTLNNRGGKYSPRNPMSPYYGKIGRNTPLRISVPGGETRLELDGSATGNVSTPDAAALDITGDIDLRVDAEIDWYAPGTQTLIGKWETAPNGLRSYLLWLHDGLLELKLGDGRNSDPAFTQTFTQPLPTDLPGRVVLRATADVDNGAGGWTRSLYWGTSVNTTTWHLVGTFVISDPTPMVIRSTDASLSIGPYDGFPTIPRKPLYGKVYRAQVRRGIGGTVVADVDFTQQTAGTTSFTDSTGLPWTLNGSAELRDRLDRFYGEVTVWPPRWDLSGNDVWTPIEASGILRRLGQGAKALDSTLRRRIPTQPNLLAYWPMEDGPDAVQFASPVAGVAPMNFAALNPASRDDLPSSNALPVLDSAGNPGVPVSFSGRVPHVFGTLAGWQVRMVYRLDKVLTDGPWTVMRMRSTGSATDIYVRIGISDITGNLITRVLGYDEAQNLIFSGDILVGTDVFNQWNTLRFFLEQETSGTVRWGCYFQDVGGNAGGFENTYSGTIGQVLSVLSPENGFAPALDGMAVGHIAVFGASQTTAYDGAITGYAGETADERLIRLSGEEHIPIRVTSADASIGAELVGPQRPETLLNLLGEAADADGGVLTEDRDRLGLTYRDRTTLYNQAPKLTLDYSAGEVWDPIEPVDDDADLKNDVTVTRNGGSSARAVLDQGPLSVLPPPAGVGIYDDAVTLNLFSDDQAEPQAYWRMALGTWDEARYPSVTVLLHAAPHLAPAVTSVREGDKIRLSNLPAWAATSDVDLLVDGYSETIRSDQWEITFNCRPAGPYTVGVTDDEILGRADTDGSVISEALSETDNALIVETPQGPWIDTINNADELPLDIAIGGEVATVTRILPWAADSFLRTVSSGWGAGETGQTWVPAGAAATDFSVEVGNGVVTMNSTANHFQQLLADIGDCEILTGIAVAQLATGQPLTAGVMLRAAGSFYRCRVIFGTDHSVKMDLINGSAGVGPAVDANVVYTVGVPMMLRVRITGQRVQAKVWPSVGTEPVDWRLDQTVTSNTIASGAIGVYTSVVSGNTNTAPVFKFNMFETITPQAFTVTRSVNGIVKPHEARTSLSLAHPTTIAL